MSRDKTDSSSRGARAVGVRPWSGKFGAENLVKGCSHAVYKSFDDPQDGYKFIKSDIHDVYDAASCRNFIKTLPLDTTNLNNPYVTIPQNTRKYGFGDVFPWKDPHDIYISRRKHTAGDPLFIPPQPSLEDNIENHPSPLIENDTPLQKNDDNMDDDDTFDHSQPPIQPMHLHLTPSKRPRPSSPAKTEHIARFILLHVPDFVTESDLQEHFISTLPDVDSSKYTIATNQQRPNDPMTYAIISTFHPAECDAILNATSNSIFMNQNLTGSLITLTERSDFTLSNCDNQTHRNTMAAHHIIKHAKQDCPAHLHRELSTLINSTTDLNKFGMIYFQWKHEETTKPSGTNLNSS
jgi:hypothetical protein